MEDQVALSIKIPTSLDKRLNHFILERSKQSGFIISKSQLVRQLLTEALDNRHIPSAEHLKDDKVG